MGIDPGRPWGRPAQCPAKVIPLGGDRELASHVPASGLAVSTCVTLSAGNLWRCMGAPRSASAGAPGVAVAVDGLELASDGGIRAVVADSLVVRRPWWRGGALVGRVVVASNSGMRGGTTVLPRAHPGDGEWDVLSVDAAMGMKARLMALRRSRRGDHLPHPRLAATRFVDLALEVSRGEVVRVDGARLRGLRRGATLRLVVVPDRWILHFASPTV